MPTYDSISTPGQIGADLQQFSSNGWPPPPPSPNHVDPDINPASCSYWDGNEHILAGVDFGAVDFAMSLADICIHQGELYVVWVEPQWNGSVMLPRGPFVARFHGAAWEMLGGELEPTLSPIPLRFSDGFSSSEPPFPGGSRYFPGRPRIKSDNTDIYVAYTVHVVETGRHPPPVGSWVRGDAYRHVISSTEHQNWSPRRVVVRRWEDPSWTVFGEIAAKTFNTQFGSNGNGAVDFGGLFSTRLELAASADEPGVCYVGFQESGRSGPVSQWTGPPVSFHIGLVFGTDHYPGCARRSCVVRLDGSTTTHDFVFIDFPPGEDEAAQVANLELGGGGGLPGMVLRNESGVGYALMTGSDGQPNMIRIDDEAVLQGMALGTRLPALQCGTHDAIYSRFLVQEFPLVSQIIVDGSTPFEPLDFAFFGTGAESPDDPAHGLYSIPFQYPNADAGGIWSICAGYAYNGWILHYHRDCVGWSILSPSWLPSPDLINAGLPALIQHGNTLYAAGAFYNPNDLSQDLQIKVFAIQILRNALGCDGDSGDGGGGGATGVPGVFMPPGLIGDPGDSGPPVGDPPPDGTGVFMAPESFG